MLIVQTETESSLANRPSLLARLRDWRQQTAWREFDHDYPPLLRNVARKAGLPDAEADEVAQECLIAVAKKIGEFEHAGRRGSFRAWLYQQARWRIADQFRAPAPDNRPERRSPNLRERDEAMSGHADSAIGAPTEEHTDADQGASEARMTDVSEVDPDFERLWDAEWADHVRREALERAIALEPEAAGWRSRYADLFRYQGRLTEERTEQELAMQRAPNNPYFNDDYSEIFASSGAIPRPRPRPRSSGR